MNKIRVIVRDHKTLVLDEDAKKGDIIDLEELGSIDFTLVEDAIRNNKDKYYNQKLEDVKQQNLSEIEKLKLQIKQEYQDKISDLKNEITELNSKINSNEKEFKIKLDNKDKEKAHELTLKETVVEQKYDKQLQDLESKNKLLEEKLSSITKSLNDEANSSLMKQELEFKNKEIETVKKYEDEITKLKNDLQAKDSATEIKLLEQERKIKEKSDAEIKKLENEKLELDKTITQLTFQKSVKNVKTIGEDLEKECNAMVIDYFQNGFFNCTWKKDNEVVKENDEDKGSKADYILKIYADEHKLENELLTSVCMDMKDENPESTNKNKNEKYYKQLNNNRNKKNCKYAVLVSNLERDVDLPPIFKVTEYEDMYVVRPEFLMTFINLIVSLNVKFKELLLRAKKEDKLFEDKDALKEEFEKLKKTYLENPLQTLGKQLDEIDKQANKILDAADAIKSSKRKIIDDYVEEITKKLERFNINKIVKKLDKLENEQD